ncbi:DUF4249 domain-containing protein [Flavihumibacter fluvii]|uniref:DUF4249 domain-containing protein n=1 Tax=Flavihumibacter fluvii TaxID=2838157 RepID=UPI001BDE1CA2|nr:DUF4249 domain-containing protein [Flavihumibacter fluvii]ULQ51306.1 DUF4249 domain-containing protein [Flavihumibacter fluvii]
MMMYKTIQQLLLTGCFILALFGCKKPFDAPAGALDNSILVVEGTIAVGENAENTFKLSRLSPIESSTAGIPEFNAAVIIVSSTGTTWPLLQEFNGTYRSTLTLPAGDRYKVLIQTERGDQYESALQDVVHTPEIDSITWEQPDELNLFVHTHDPSNATRYYRWEYEETWEYHSWYEATLKFENGSIVSRPMEEQVFTCWKKDSSKNIHIANSIALQDDVISYQPLNTLTKTFPLDQNKLSVRYSILVKQLGLSKEAYNFWDILKKNTELTGTLFDPQPSRMPTNITCINEPAREVIGYVSVGQVSEKRIFIRNSELSSWPVIDDTDNCPRLSKTVAEAEAFILADPFNGPVTYVERTQNQYVYISSRSCYDCTLRGGNTAKPSYW